MTVEDNIINLFKDNNKSIEDNQIRKGGKERINNDYNIDNNKRDFNKQYWGVYRQRLSQIRPNLVNKCYNKWKEYNIKALADLREQTGQLCILIGTIYKHQTLKSSILKELSEELQLVPEPKRKNFVDDSDLLILEDELQRIRLIGDVINIKKMVTGVVCAVLGFENADGMFEISDYCFADLPMQKSIPVLEDDKFIVILSGLNIANEKTNGLSIQLFIDWITGVVGSAIEQNVVCKIVRLIIAGNSIGDLKSDDTVINTYNSSSPMFNSTEALKKMDDMLCELSQSIEVDLMPGEFDPTNIMLPQKPIHYCMFPKARQLSSFKGVFNPYETEVEGRVICGSSGQSVQDILRYTTIESQMEALKYTLEWGHMAPTAPDTLPCVPVFEEDPFIIKNCPHVYFSGNADNFETDLFEDKRGQKIRTVCVPSFTSKPIIALINLRTLHCYPMSFQIHSC